MAAPSFGIVETALVPGSALDDLTRVTALIDRAEPRVRRRFLKLIDASRDLGGLEEIAGLLEAGRVDDALQISNQIMPGLSTTLERVYGEAGLSAAQVLRSQRDTLFDFNTLNDRAVRSLQNTRLRLVREFTAEQSAATREILSDAFARGLAPVEQARLLKGSIGLTQRQARAVNNYRRLLERGSSEALSRKLRDRRFDPSIKAAIRGDRALSSAQIDRMVERYRERYIQYRARTIARTETQAAAWAGDEELWAQAIEEGIIDTEDLTNIWNIALRNVRESHKAMNKQEQPFGKPFKSGLGNNLRFPGDPFAPAEDSVNCQCVIARKLKRRPIRRAEGPQPSEPWYGHKPSPVEPSPRRRWPPRPNLPGMPGIPGVRPPPPSPAPAVVGAGGIVETTAAAEVAAPTVRTLDEAKALLKEEGVLGFARFRDLDALTTMPNAAAKFARTWDAKMATVRKALAAGKMPDMARMQWLQDTASKVGRKELAYRMIEDAAEWGHRPAQRRAIQLGLVPKDHVFSKNHFYRTADSAIAAAKAELKTLGVDLDALKGFKPQSLADLDKIEAARLRAGAALKNLNKANDVKPFALSKATRKNTAKAAKAGRLSTGTRMTVDLVTRDLGEWGGAAGNLYDDARLAEVKWSSSPGMRAQAVEKMNAVQLSNTSSPTTVAHEFAHHLEFRNPEVAGRIREWFDGRVTAAKLAGELEPEDIYPHLAAPDRAAELGWRDEFFDNYVGRDYRASWGGDHVGTEVLSMGTQAFYDDATFLKMLSGDPDHLALTWSVLRGY